MIEKQVGDRLILLPITKEYTEFIVKWRNNDRVNNNFIFSETFTEEMHNHWMDTKVKNGEVIQFIILIRENNKPIGSVYFRDIDYEKGVAEYGIFIGEDDEIGKGYGTEAADLAIDFIFAQTKLKYVFLRVFADNKPAISSYKAVGFTEYECRKGEVEKNGVIHDLIFMKKDNDNL